MSEPAKYSGRSDRAALLLKFLKGLLWTILVLLLLLTLMSVAIELPVHLVAGWLFYLIEVVPQVRINVELLLCSLGALLAGIVGLQWLIVRFRGCHRWSWRFTLAWYGLLTVMFGTSIAAVGIVHQTGWLFRTPTWIEWTGMGRQTKAMNNAKQVLLCALYYAKDHDGNLPTTWVDMIKDNAVADGRIFVAPVDSGSVMEPLVYAGTGLSDTDHGNLPVIWTPRPDLRGKRVVTRLDGSSQVVSEKEFQEMLAMFREHHAKKAGASR